MDAVCFNGCQICKIASKVRAGRRESEEKDARCAAEEDELDGIDFIDGAADESEEEKEDADVELPRRVGRAEVFGGKQEKRCGSKETYYGGTEALEDVFYDGVGSIFHQELADEEHEDEGGEDDGEGGCEAAQDGPGVPVAGVGDAGVAHIGGGVDADGSGRHLADCDNVGELSHSEPVVSVDDFALYHGNHGVAAAEAEESDFEEAVEEF